MYFDDGMKGDGDPRMLAADQHNMMTGGTGLSWQFVVQ
jgi:hypothetical protein